MLVCNVEFFMFTTEIMSRQQLENIFTTVSTSIPTPVPLSRPRSIHKPRSKIRIPPITRPKLRHIPKAVLADKDESEKQEMAKTNPISKNTWYQWND